MSKANRVLLVCFMEVDETNEFCAHFNIGRIHVKQFWKWTITSNTVSANKIADVMSARVCARSTPLKVTIFANFPDLSSRDIGTQQACQVLRASLAIAMCVEKHPWVWFFFVPFWQSSVALISRDQFPQTVLSSARRGDVASLNIATPSVRKVHMFFHCIAMVEKTIQTKILKRFHSYSTETLMGYTVQKSSKTWKALAEPANPAPLANSVSPMILFDMKRIDFSCWASETKDLKLFCSSTINRSATALSTTRITWNMRCGTDLTHWTLSFGF